MHSPLPLSLAAALLAAPAFAQDQYQTLPSGFDAVEGDGSTAYPQNTNSDEVWQWHYDASEFEANGPIRITDIAVRPKQGLGIAAWSFDNWTVTLGESPNEFDAPDSVLGKNFIRSETCRTGSWSGGPLIPLPFGTVGGRVWMGLTSSFVYDPSTGNDFVIQIEKCGSNLLFGTSIDGVWNDNGSRIGNNADCTADIANFAQSNFAPIISIRYQAASQTLPAGYEESEGNGSVGWPVTTAAEQKWQWHYDSGEFAESAPIAITEIWVRPNAGSALNGFFFEQFDVKLASASTNYAAGDHDPEFGLNIHQQKRVRSGAWSGGPVGASAGVGEWVPLGLQDAFVYDPSSGRDFIVQIEKCGAATPWNSTMDGRVGPSIGGNRYGNNGDCEALTQDTVAGQEFVPLIRIDYRPVDSTVGAVTKFPWREDFDETIANRPPRGWDNIEGEALDAPSAWNVQSIATPSAGTGPDEDHTSGFGKFAVVEDSLSDNQAVTLTTPILDLSTLPDAEIAFWVHSVNAGPISADNTLSIDVFRVASGTLDESVATIGDLATSVWTEFVIDLGGYAGSPIRIHFRVDNDNATFHHDIAIDDVRVYQPTLQFGESPSTLALLDTDKALTANGEPVALGRPGPYFRDYHYGEPVTISVRGQPNQALAVLLGPLNPGAFAIPGSGQLDLGPVGVTTLIGGVSTDGTGSYEFSTPWTIPQGQTLSLQAVALTGGVSPLFALSNAVSLTSL